MSAKSAISAKSPILSSADQFFAEKKSEKSEKSEKSLVLPFPMRVAAEICFAVCIDTG
jgi:hypothetical protein